MENATRTNTKALKMYALAILVALGAGIGFVGCVSVRRGPNGERLYEPPALVEACSRRDVRKVERLLKDGADPNVHERDMGSTPLHVVVRNTWPTDARDAGAAMTRLLLDHGADPMALDNSGYTPIEWAGVKNDLAVAIIVERLDQLAASAKTLGKDAPTLIPPDWFAMSAAMQSDLHVLRVRLAQGADPNAPGQDGKPLLHAAVLMDERGLVDMLLKAGARVNERAQITGDTALHVAVTFDKADMIKVLLAHGADPFQANDIGQSAITEAADKKVTAGFDTDVIATQAEDAEGWGESPSGIQARLRRERTTWPAGKAPRLRLDVWNHWTRKLELHADLGDIELLVDGERYRLGRATGSPTPFGPQARVQDVVLELGDGWTAADGTTLKLAPGEHRVQARVKAIGIDGKKDISVATGERMLRITS